ncbi:MAG: cyanophycinase [Bacteroidota bacterium]|nr:cyanophycinase [Bacteroidota bacterium]
MKKFTTVFILIVLLLAAIGYSQTPVTINPSTTKHGPEKGSLIIIGGQIPPEIWKKFTELAGGEKKASIVVVTAALGDSAGFNPESVEMIKRETGISNVTLLHTKNLAEANSEKFIHSLKTATGVFFVGGRQWRIADSYLNTMTHQAFFEVLERGGVIAGTSAGATIQGSFLWRGDTSGAHILVGDHTQGLGFLRNSVIDQHLLKRNRMFDLVDVVKSNLQLIGIGLDESTAILVQHDTLEVMGKSYVAIYDYSTIQGNGPKHTVGDKEDFTASNGPFFFLHEGQKYDLGSRAVIKGKTDKKNNR